MKDETRKLFTLLAKETITEAESKEANLLLKDKAINADFSKALIVAFLDAVGRGVIDAVRYENVLEELSLKKKPSPN